MLKKTKTIMNFEYSGVYLSVYPINIPEGKEKPLTGISPSGGNDHITIAYIGKENATTEMKDDICYVVNRANEQFMNEVATVTDVVLNSFQTKRKQLIDGKLQVTQETRHDILFVLDEKTSQRLEEFQQEILVAYPRKYSYHISKSYHWNLEDAEECYEQAREQIPFQVRLGATYDD